MKTTSEKYPECFSSLQSLESHLCPSRSRKARFLIKSSPNKCEECLFTSIFFLKKNLLFPPLPQNFFLPRPLEFPFSVKPERFVPTISFIKSVKNERSRLHKPNQVLINLVSTTRFWWFRR